MELEEKLVEVKGLIGNNQFAEAAAGASEIIALVRAMRVLTSNVHEHELKIATVLLAIAEMNQAAFERAADAFLALKIDTEELLPGTKWTAKAIAVMAVLAVISSSTSSRITISTTLTDAVKSCVRFHFDDDPFPLIIELGTSMKTCNFERAINQIENLVETSVVKSVVAEPTISQIKQSVLDVCLIQLLSCHSRIRLSDLANELRLSEDSLIRRLESLILTGKGGLSSHRIDLQHRCVQADAGCSESSYRYLQEALGNMEILTFRKSLAQANIRIEN